jgi:hypothetical protein
MARPMGGLYRLRGLTQAGFPVLTQPNPLVLAVKQSWPGLPAKNGRTTLSNSTATAAFAKRSSTFMATIVAPPVLNRAILCAAKRFTWAELIRADFMPLEK